MKVGAYQIQRFQKVWGQSMDTVLRHWPFSAICETAHHLLGPCQESAENNWFCYWYNRCRISWAKDRNASYIYDIFCTVFSFSNISLRSSRSKAVGQKSQWTRTHQLERALDRSKYSRFDFKEKFCCKQSATFNLTLPWRSLDEICSILDLTLG